MRWTVVAVAVAGAALGSKILFWLEDPRLTWSHLRDPYYLLGGKTIVGALAGGLLAVELAKRYLGLRKSTGDLYAIPLAVGIAIGRTGCFLTGLSDNTYGTPSQLPWAIDFGDSVPRHPTQLYEIVFLLAVVPILYRILEKIAIRKLVIAPCVESFAEESNKAPSEAPVQFHAGDAFRFFMAAYALFRLLVDFIKPYPRILLGLGGIQWACIVILLYYSADVARWLGSIGSNERFVHEGTPHR